MTTKVTVKKMKYRLQELSKATAGIKKLLAKAEEAAHRAALADQLPGGSERRLRNEMVLRRLRKARRGIEVVLSRVDSLVSEYHLKDGLRK